MIVNDTRTKNTITHHFVPLKVDMITASSALAKTMHNKMITKSQIPIPYILYERSNEVLFAAGKALEITLDRNGLHLKTSKGTRTEPLGDRPLEQVQTTLTNLAKEKGLIDSNWRAYGWAAFELSYLLQGLPISEDVGTLLYLFLPYNEARIQSGAAELKVTDPEVAVLWEQALHNAHFESSQKCIQVDEISDTNGYLNLAADAIKAINNHKLRKLILSRSVFLKEDIDLIASYQMLRRNNTPVRSFLLQLGGITAAGVSPETIVEVSPTRMVSTQPIAGTRAYTGQKEIDASLRDELLSDPKEIYEHALSVKLALDEITDISEPGTVSIENFMHIVSRGSVQHIASRVNGQLRSDASCWDAFGSVFPAVSASGIPKRQACIEIHRREQSPRGLYSGAILTVDYRGELDAALVLRSFYQKDGATWLRAGAGLISQSTPERELEETREKLRSVSRFLVPSSGNIT